VSRSIGPSQCLLHLQRNGLSSLSCAAHTASHHCPPHMSARADESGGLAQRTKCGEADGRAPFKTPRLCDLAHSRRRRLTRVRSKRDERCAGHVLRTRRSCRRRCSANSASCIRSRRRDDDALSRSLVRFRAADPPRLLFACHMVSTRATPSANTATHEACYWRLKVDL
jgi:hypothetical protein